MKEDNLITKLHIQLIEKEQKINELQERIEELKEELDYKELWRIEYKTRIDKAIEYIENKEILIAIMGTYYYKILDILKGE